MILVNLQRKKECKASGKKIKLVKNRKLSSDFYNAKLYAKNSGAPFMMFSRKECDLKILYLTTLSFFFLSLFKAWHLS